MEKITCQKEDMLVAYLKNNTKISYPMINKLLRTKDIKVNGKRVNSDIQLSIGDIVEVYLPKTNIVIVYQDDNIVICNKPKGIEVCDGKNETLLKQATEKLNSKLYAVHRIDLNTDGLVVFAKNEAAKASLDDAFKHHKIEKNYLAEVFGVPSIPQQKLIAYHKKDAKNALVYIEKTPKPGFSKIITCYKVLENRGKTALLDVEIETGKTHQIRAHLAYIGHPIVGDNKYGNKKLNNQFNKSKQQLSAYKLTFKNLLAPLEYLNGKTFTL